MTVYAGITFDAELATAVSPMGFRTCNLGDWCSSQPSDLVRRSLLQIHVRRYQISLQGENWMRSAVAFFTPIPSR